MKKSIQLICENVTAEEVDYILPFIAVITNPSGSVEIQGRNIFSYEIVCHGGSAIFRLEQQECLVTKNQDFIISGNIELLRMSFSEDFKGHVMAQTKEFRDSIVTMDRYAVNKYYRNPLLINLTEDQSRQYYLFFEWIKYVLRKNPKDAETRIRNLLSATFWIFSDYEAPVESLSCRNDQIAARFLDMLEREDASADSIDYFAERLKVSKRSLSRAVKHATGATLTEHLVKQKLERAKAMISAMDSSTPMEMVSDRLGFSSMASFSRFFKTGTGMTPTDFRNLKK